MATKKPAKKVVIAKKAAKPAAKPAKKAAPVKKVSKPIKKAAPAKKAVPAKKVLKPVSKPVKKAAPPKKSVPAKKSVPVKPAPVKKLVKPVAKPSKPTVPVKKQVPVKQEVKPIAKPAIKAEPAPAKKITKPIPQSAPVKSVTAPKPIVKPTVEVKSKVEVKPVTAPAKPVKKQLEPIKEVKLPKTTTKSSVAYKPQYTPLEKRTDNYRSNEPIVRYSDSELTEFRELINRKLETAKKELAYLQGLITRKDEMGGDEGDNRYITMEDGGMSMEREQLSQMASRQISYIDHLEKAIMRIENKTYGICRVTGKLIDKARLRAVPHATLSLEAKLGLVKPISGE
jgi:RNA polymerase-binding transcription factor DksA